jgi:hypothetical protein
MGRRDQQGRGGGKVHPALARDVDALHTTNRGGGNLGGNLGGLGPHCCRGGGSSSRDGWGCRQQPEHGVRGGRSGLLVTVTAAALTVTVTATVAAAVATTTGHGALRRCRVVATVTIAVNGILLILLLLLLIVVAVGGVRRP